MGRGRKRPPGVPGGAEPGSPGEPGGVRPGTPGGGGSGSGPRRFTEAEQRAFLEELEGSGESVQAFARRIGVTVWTVSGGGRRRAGCPPRRPRRGAGPLPWKRGRGSRRSGQRPASGRRVPSYGPDARREAVEGATGSPVCRSRTSGSSGACRRPRSGSRPGRTRRAGRRRSRRRRADGEGERRHVPAGFAGGPGGDRGDEAEIPDLRSCRDLPVHGPGVGCREGGLLLSREGISPSDRCVLVAGWSQTV